MSEWVANEFQYWRDAPDRYHPDYQAQIEAREANIFFGWSDGTSCKFIAASLVTGTLTLTLNGTDVRSIVIDEEIGLDSGDGAKPRAGYIKSGTITGLLPFTQYNFEVSFGATTFTGRFFTAPGEDDDYCVYLNTCERNNRVPGHYSIMRDEIENNKTPHTVIANIHVDDNFGYIDSRQITGDDPGHISTGSPPTTLLEYDYALAYLDMFALFAFQEDDDFGSPNQMIGRTRLENNMWCMNHMNYIPQWGDHEFRNDFHGNFAATPNPMHTTGTDFLGAGYTMYMKLLGPLGPPSAQRGASTSTSKPWAMEYGAACFVAGDAITEHNGAVGATTPSTVAYGTEQLKDILEVYDQSDCPFKIFLSGIRMSHPGSADCLKFEQIAEYNAFIRAKDGGADYLGAGFSSIMANPKTNGILGNFMSFSGDFHGMHTLRHYKADAAYETEAYLDTELGTSNGSAVRRAAPGDTGDIITANTDELSEVMYQGGINFQFTQDANATFGGGGVLMSVTSSLRNAELAFTIRSFGSDTIWGHALDASRTGEKEIQLDSQWTRRFVHRVTDNFGVDPDASDEEIGLAIPAAGQAASSQS